MKKKLLIFWVMMSLIAGSAQASAVFTDRASFEAAISGYVIEDFESYPTSGTTGSGALPQINFNKFSVASVPNAVKILDEGFAGSKNTTPGGAKYLYLDTDIGFQGSVTTISFYSGINFIGFDYTYSPVWGSQLNVEVEGNSFLLGNVDTSGYGFWGYIGDNIFSTIIIDSGSISGYGIDQVTFNATAPLPSAVLLLGSGLLGLAGWRIRFRED